MAKIDRHTGNLIPFGRTATSADRKVFGGTIESETLDDNLTPELQEGWQATTSPTLFPKLRDFNAAMFTAQQLIAYLIQRGIAEYHAQQTYYIGSLCTNPNGDIFVSQADNNTNELLTDPLFWKKVSDSDWDNITNKPATFPPSAHNQAYSTITSTPELPLGVGQTWSGNLIGVTRFAEVYYSNSSGRSIVIVIGVNPVHQDFLKRPNSTTTILADNESRTYIIPDGYSFKTTNNTFWHELV